MPNPANEIDGTIAVGDKGPRASAIRSRRTSGSLSDPSFLFPGMQMQAKSLKAWESSLASRRTNRNLDELDGFCAFNAVN